MVDTENLFFNSIINSMPSTIVVVDDNLITTYISKAGEVFGFKLSQEIIGKSLFEIMPYLQRHKNTIKLALENNQPISLGRIPHNVAAKRQSYLEVIVFSLSNCGNNKLALRVDDISEKITLEQQIIQSDRLASLGLLSAGIAHEINNSINFVYASVTPLKNDLRDIITLLDKYSKIEIDKIAMQLDEIEKFKQEIDFAYTIDEINRLIESIYNGANRTIAIVKELKMIAKPEEDIIKTTNIHSGLDSIIELIQVSLKDRIIIIKNYGNLDSIECYSEKLNQVFMNIILNAVQAIKDKGEIVITTKQSDENLVITFKDNGQGMTEDTMHKIFQPFFTTKPVGQGTGLGLAISYDIIKKHNGSIDVKSEVNKGSEFSITLPIKFIQNKIKSTEIGS